MNTNKHLKLGVSLTAITGLGYYLYTKYNSKPVSCEKCKICEKKLKTKREFIFEHCKKCYIQEDGDTKLRNILLDEVCENGIVDIILEYKKYTDWVNLIDINNNNWDNISKLDLSEEFIRTYNDKVNWEIICEKHILSEDFMREQHDYIIYKGGESIWYNQEISIQFIIDYEDKVDWYWLSVTSNLALEVIREFADRLNWNGISRSNNNLTDDFVREFADRLNLEELIKHGPVNLSEELIKEFGIDMGHMKFNYNLSDDFVREFVDRLNWDKNYKNVSEKMLLEFEHKIKWDDVLSDLSRKFVLKNKSFLRNKCSF